MGGIVDEVSMNDAYTSTSRLGVIHCSKVRQEPLVSIIKTIHTHLAIEDDVHPQTLSWLPHKNDEDLMPHHMSAGNIGWLPGQGYVCVWAPSASQPRRTGTRLHHHPFSTCSRRRAVA